MTERILRPTGKTVDQMEKEARMRQLFDEFQANQQPQSARRLRENQSHLNQRQQEAQRRSAETAQNNLNAAKTRPIGKRALIGFGITVGVALSAAMVTNTFGIRDTVGNATVNLLGGNGPSMSAIEYEATDLSDAGASVFAPGNCTLPENIAVVATIDAEVDMIPQLLTAESPDKPITVGPYMTKENLKETDDQPSDGVEDPLDMTKFITGSYNEAHLVKLPVGLSICMPDDSGAFIDSSETLTIDRSKFVIKLHDPNQLFTKNIVEPIYQNDGADADPDASKNEFYTLPNPGYKFFIPDSDDTVRNASRDALSTAVYTDTFEKALLYKLQDGVKEQLKKAKPGQDNIVLPPGAKSLEQVIDEHIKKVIRGNDQVDLDKTGTYKFEVDIAMNAARTAKVTDNDPTSGVNPLNGIAPINLIEDVRLTKALIELKTMVEPEIIETPEPLPADTETATTP